MLQDIFETKPDAVNSEGTSFWIDKEATRYATDKGLTGIKVMYLRDKTGYKTRVVVKDQKYIFESQKLEDLYVHLDILVLTK